MDAGEIISSVYTLLQGTFRDLAPWPAKDAALRSYRAAPGEWCINEILEHIVLANRYLLLLIEKGRTKAMKKTDPARIADALRGYRLMDDRLEQVGVNNSFEWKCPVHMRPSGGMSPEDARLELEAQRGTLLDVLADLKNGEGALQKTGMSVNRLGKLDVYQYICFLLMHCRRHTGQMEEIEKACGSHKPAGDAAAH